MVPILEEQGYALLEPTPIIETERPPVVPDRFDSDPNRKDAAVHIAISTRGVGFVVCDAVK